LQFTDFSLDQRLLQSLKHMGIATPTAIQEQALPIALAGKDLMASSKTGSGKTLAFLLPALQRVISTRALSKRDPRVLILLPTRELAHQVYSQLRLLVANTQYKAISVLGGENFNDQAKALAKEPHFIVATPGRIADHLEQKNLFLNGLELLVLDEADRMLDLGFAPQLKAINEAADHKRRQTLMLSHKQVIIFTATRADTERLAAKLSAQGFATAALSGELKQTARNQIMDQFARGQQQILVTTDVASRGLDLLNVSLVINFDMPKFAEEYVHRIGRTGRAGAKGDAISLVGPKDWDNFKKVQLFLRKTFEISVIKGLEAKFSGLKEKPKSVATKGVVKANTKAKSKPKSHLVKAAPSRDKRFITGVDVGDAPMRKKPAAQLLQDNDDEI